MRGCILSVIQAGFPFVEKEGRKEEGREGDTEEGREEELETAAGQLVCEDG